MNKETDMRFADKEGLITAGNGGISSAIAQLFLAEGANVTITRGNQATLEAAARKLGPDLAAIRADMTDVGAIERAIATAAEKFGNLDIVFANVGIAATTPGGKTSLGTFEQILKINLTEVLFPIQVAALRTEKAVSRRQI
jgi:NAD(P)-dependent dehydrogenase (short-subunit alcohol dehydrogenase family)